MKAAKDQHERKRAKPHYAWLVLIGCCFMQAGGLGAVLDATGVFFVPVCEDLGCYRSEITLYLSFYFIATIFAMPVVGKWIAKYNINVLLSVAFALVALAVAAMGFYTQPWQWWISGVVFGLAGSFIFVIPTPILMDNWFKKRRGLSLGIAMSFSGIGGAVLSPLFTLLIENVGWRNAYVISAVIIAVMVLPWTMFVFKLHPSDKGLKPYGWEPGDEQVGEAVGSKNHNLQFSGVPLKRAIRSVPFVCLFLFAGLTAYFSGFNSQLPGYAISIGYDSLTASFLLTAVMIGNVIEKLLVGMLNDIKGVRFTVNVQLVMVALGLLGLCFSANSYALLIVSCMLFAAQNSLVAVSTPLIVREIFGEADFPKIFADVRIGTGAIGCLGPITVSGIYDVTGSFVPAFMVGIVVVAIGYVTVRVAYATKDRLYVPEEASTERSLLRG